MASSTQQGQAGLPSSKDLMAAMADPAAWLESVNTAMKQAVPDLKSFKFPELPSAGLDPLPYKIDPAKLQALQQEYVQALSKLWSERLEGRKDRPADRRFGGEDWQGLHAYIADVYLLTSKYLNDLANAIEAEPKAKAKIQFATQQLIDAMSPANFLATNPEALKRIIDTNGESLQAGIVNMLADLRKGRISQTDETAFEIGKNVAVSEGSVVFQNEVFQLIQYKPLTETVYQVPLLIVPPCINKYYILDLQPDSSFVRYAVEQGNTVFLMSWVSATQEQAHLTWDNYVQEGAITAIDVVRKITKQPKINILGFCVGGTILTTALAVEAARGEQPAASLTLLTTFLDFSDTGVMDVFIDEGFVKNHERKIGGIGGKAGVLQGKDLATTFAFLRPNDLVWNYVVSNYLKGQPPVAFDLLYWNADGTNLPGPFYSWYLRNMYLENNIKVPGKVKISGESIDLGAIQAPAYLYSSREDHIVPWQSAYASTQLLKGPNRFVVGASGHIAGVINPPAKKKRSYWAHDPSDNTFPADYDTWFNSAQEIKGSWWPDWSAWLAGYSGEKVPAPAKYGNSKYKSIEAAPGSYVKVRTM